jgi:spoIIIJ-associated protein
MRSVETIGKSVEDAIQQALQQLGVSREQVEVEVLHPGTPGIFGVGGEPARVRVTVKETAQDSPAEFVKTFVTDLIQAAGWDLTVSEVREQEGEIYLNLEGSDTGLIIGRQGTRLAALQLIVQAALARRWQQPLRVTVDASHYRERRQASLVQLAINAADKARSQKRPIRLRNLSSAERRVIHMTLQSDPTVFTFSEGEGADRVVVVAPVELRQRLLRQTRLPRSRPPRSEPAPPENPDTAQGVNPSP